MFAAKAVPLTLRQVRQLQKVMGAAGASASKHTAPQAQLPLNILFLLRGEPGEFNDQTRSTRVTEREPKIPQTRGLRQQRIRLTQRMHSPCDSAPSHARRSPP